MSRSTRSRPNWCIGRRSVLGLLGSAAAGAIGAARLSADASGNARRNSIAARLSKGKARKPQGSAAFPLKISANERHFVDDEGAPFLMHGDTAWSLIAALDKDETLRYLDDRQKRGFNTVLVSLIEHKFAPNPPANAYGDSPFLQPGDFTTPNERYFAHADWVLSRAAERGFLALLVPAYCGAGGGDEGWYQEMVANGADKLYEYGRYLGQRFGQHTNIMWCHGGDYDPPDKDLLRSIVKGISAYDSRALHTAHGNPEGKVADFWENEPWLDVNNVYTYRDVHDRCHEAYKRSPTRPFFLIESAYENEHDATEQRLRAQAYQALLSGAAGQLFGNNPIWHFTGPGIYAAPYDWEEALNSRGAKSMRHLADLFLSLPWWRLEPDIDNALLREGSFVDQLLNVGLGEGLDRVVAAREQDGEFALIYLPEASEFVVDLQRLAGPKVSIHWYDPANGHVTMDADSPFPASGSISLKSDSVNSHDFADWVLVLESHD